MQPVVPVGPPGSGCLKCFAAEQMWMRVGYWLVVCLVLSALLVSAGCLTSPPGDLVRDAGAYRQSGDLNRSLQLLDQAVMRDANDSAAWAERAEVLNALDRKEEALASVDRSLVLDPSSAPRWIFLGDLLLEMNRTPEAVQAYNHAVARDANATSAWYGLGNAYSRLGNAQDAERAYLVALQANSSFAPAAKGLGDLLLSRGK